MRTEQIAEEGVAMRPACAEGAGRNPGEYASGACVRPRAQGCSDPEAQQLLEQIVAPENMRRAWKQVKRNKGAPGVDGQTINETLNPVLRGWINYFRLSETKGFAEALDGWIRRRLRLMPPSQWNPV